MQTDWAACLLSNCRLSRTLLSRVGQYITFILHRLYFNQWPLQTVYFRSWRYIISGKLRQKIVTAWFLTPGDWLLLDLLTPSTWWLITSWPPILAIWFPDLVPGFGLLSLSLDLQLILGLQSWPNQPTSDPTLSISVLLALILSIILSLKLGAKDDRSASALCQKQNCYAIGNSEKEMLRIWWASLLWFSLTNIYEFLLCSLPP